MTEIKKLVTPHLELGQTAPANLHGATFTLSTGHIAEVSSYGKSAYIYKWEGSPTEAAILFLREVVPSNPKVNDLKVTKVVKVGRSNGTTQRYYTFRFPFGTFVLADNNGTAMRKPTDRVYKADGTFITWEAYGKLVEASQAERKVKLAEEEAEKQRKRNAGRKARLAYISQHTENSARMMEYLASWWEYRGDDTANGNIRQVLNDNGGTIDALLTALTGIKDSDM